ncbi:hypothetical protein GCM10010103_17780 [Streptomyces paradoxus]|uniref:Uncharacterized protein n=1 Tax=Streptomyces paradoxus TaxID=66375 RepID=A0A7W9T9Q5_9ACTN|nr:hypothetical protein [Streptomyces paradoxus]MBB6075882.1 hypothetical protein [Streptomyces paradoxus]
MNPSTSRFALRVRVQIVLLAVITVATLLSALAFSEASGTYQDAVRQEITRQETLLDDVRTVYAEDARLAFEVAAASARADALRPVRHEGRTAASEYEIAAQTAFALRSTARSGSPLHDAYRHRELGYDLPRRLADLQRDKPGRYGLAPEATMRSGDTWVIWGLGFAVLAVAAVIAGVAAANVLRPRALRRPPGPDRRRVIRNVQLLPQPALTRSGESRLAPLLQLFVVVLLMVLPLSAVYAAGGEQRAQAEAARKATQLGTAALALGQRTAFLAEGRRTAELTELRAMARERASLETGITPGQARHERVVAAVETRAAERVREIAEYMGRPPRRADRVDAATATMLAEDPGHLSDLRKEQKRQVSFAELASSRGVYLGAAAAMAAIAEVLVAAAVADGRRRWLLWPAGAAVCSAVLTARALI